MLSWNRPDEWTPSAPVADQLFPVCVIITAFLCRVNMADVSWHAVTITTGPVDSNTWRPLSICSAGSFTSRICLRPLTDLRFTSPGSFTQNSSWKCSRFTLLDWNCWLLVDCCCAQSHRLSSRRPRGDHVFTGGETTALCLYTNHTTNKTQLQTTTEHS